MIISDKDHVHDDKLFYESRQSQVCHLGKNLSVETFKRFWHYYANKSFIIKKTQDKTEINWNGKTLKLDKF